MGKTIEAGVLVHVNTLEVALQYKNLTQVLVTTSLSYIFIIKNETKCFLF